MLLTNIGSIHGVIHRPTHAFAVKESMNFLYLLPPLRMTGLRSATQPLLKQTTACSSQRQRHRGVGGRILRSISMLVGVYIYIYICRYMFLSGLVISAVRIYHLICRQGIRYSPAINRLILKYLHRLLHG
jgi:hypothetical protein